MRDVVHYRKIPRLAVLYFLRGGLLFVLFSTLSLMGVETRIQNHVAQRVERTQRERDLLLRKDWPFVNFVVLGRAYAQSIPIRSKTIEIHYDGHGNISGTSGNESNTEIDGPPLAPKTIIVSDMSRLIQRRLGRATLLVVYASYCSACRKLMPTAAHLSKKWRGEGLSVVTVSVDPQEHAFFRYANRFEGAMDLIRVGAHSGRELSKQARQLGITVIKESFAIPVIALFDINGRVVTEHVGNASYRLLDDSVGQLLSKRQAMTIR